MERQEHRNSFVILVLELLHFLELADNVKDCSLLCHVLDQSQPFLNAPNCKVINGLFTLRFKLFRSGWVDDRFHMVVEQSQNLGEGLRAEVISSLGLWLLCFAKRGDSKFFDFFV